MKNIGILLGALCMLWFTGACTQGKGNGETHGEKDNTVTIRGKVNFPQQEGLIVLEKAGTTGMMAVDSVNLGADSTFQFSVEIEEPGFYRLNFYDNQYVTLVLDDEDVVVTADGNNSQGIAKVAGSTDTDYFYAVEEMMMELQAGVNNLNQEYIEARTTNNKEGMQAVEQKYDSMETALRTKLKEQIRSMGTSITALYAVNYLDADRDFEFLAELADKFRQEAPNSQYTQDFVTNVEDMRVLAIGKEAPEIALPNPQGDTITLSSLQGKYVLIDFWAAWCRPCRMENPNVVRMYEKYKDKGFEIYGVSLDRTKDAWVEAIQADNLTWMHVSDLKYFNSVAAELYNIQAIPATYLLDKEGKIIAKNLRGKALEDKLEEIFGV